VIRTRGLDALKPKAAEAAELLRLLGNASRLQLLCQIALGERSVGQLEEELDIQQPALSQQLAELRKAGMVKTRRESRSIFYSIADARAQAILEMLRMIFCDDAPKVAKPLISAARSPSLRQKGGDTAKFARVE
jgi:DNA-binding transcriptional ArsR family regulator